MERRSQALATISASRRLPYFRRTVLHSATVAQPAADYLPFPVARPSVPEDVAARLLGLQKSAANPQTPALTPVIATGIFLAFTMYHKRVQHLVEPEELQPVKQQICQVSRTVVLTGENVEGLQLRTVRSLQSSSHTAQRLLLSMLRVALLTVLENKRVRFRFIEQHEWHESFGTGSNPHFWNSLHQAPLTLCTGRLNRFPVLSDISIFMEFCLAFQWTTDNEYGNSRASKAVGIEMVKL